MSQSVLADLPWIIGRGLGITGYLCIWAVTVLGLWVRHPWRQRVTRPAPEVLLRLHAALAALALVVTFGHVLAMVLDSYAGVGLTGALLPGAAHYRPTAVGLGTAGVYICLLVAASAALAGRFARLPWLPIHRTAALSFGCIWLHGLLAGSDSRVLLPIYTVTGSMTACLWLSRRLVRESLA